jgi:peptide-methionine (R)-S-oxide reductase
MLKNIVIVLSFLFISCQGNTQEKKEKTAKKTDTKEIAFTVSKTEEEWKAQLTDMQFYILRKAATENPFTSELLDNKKDGVYVCAGCDTELFKSETKFDSGTGWPSFYQEIEGNVAYDTDYKIGYARTEEHCATCGGHLGHVFEDGPKPTGERHCINGAALKFVPSK